MSVLVIVVIVGFAKYIVLSVKTIIRLSPGSTQAAVYTIRTRLGGPYPQSFPKELTMGWPSLG